MLKATPSCKCLQAVNVLQPSPTVPCSPLSIQLAARNMCAKFTLEKHLENAVACTFFGMRRSAAAAKQWRRRGLHINLCAACHDALHMSAIAARLCMLQLQLGDDGVNESIREGCHIQRE